MKIIHELYMKTYGTWRYISTHSFTSALDGGECLASGPGRFTPRENSPCTRWIGGWMGPREGLGAWWREKFPAPTVTRIPDHPARSSALYHWMLIKLDSRSVWSRTICGRNESKLTSPTKLYGRLLTEFRIWNTWMDLSVQ